MQCLSRETAGNNGARATFCSSGRDLRPKALIVLNAHWAIAPPTHGVTKIQTELEVRIGQPTFAPICHAPLCARRANLGRTAEFSD